MTTAYSLSDLAKLLHEQALPSRHEQLNWLASVVPKDADIEEIQEKLSCFYYVRDDQYGEVLEGATSACAEELAREWIDEGEFAENEVTATAQQILIPESGVQDEASFTKNFSMIDEEEPPCSHIWGHNWVSEEAQGLGGSAVCDTENCSRCNLSRCRVFGDVNTCGNKNHGWQYCVLGPGGIRDDSCLWAWKKDWADSVERVVRINDKDFRFYHDRDLPLHTLHEELCAALRQHLSPFSPSWSAQGSVTGDTVGRREPFTVVLDDTYLSLTLLGEQYDDTWEVQLDQKKPSLQPK